MNKSDMKAIFSSNSDEWGTPIDLYRELDAHYNFTLDPCTTPDNPLGTPKFYTKETNGLRHSWEGERVFMNPPYRTMSDWITKAMQEKTQLIVMLLPSRTGTKWFSRLVPWMDQLVFIRGRLRFGVSLNSAPFDSIIVIRGVPDKCIMMKERDGAVIWRRDFA